MDTKIVKTDQYHIEQHTLEEAARILKEGGLVAFPTETVYGLGADATNEQAAARIYEAKGRPSDNPLIVHIADIHALSQCASEVSERALALAKAFWPGPLTMILPKGELIPYTTTGGLDTVAVRMPDHPAALELIRAAGGFIAAPSANTSGRPSPTKAEHVYEDLKGRIPLILDGGEVGIGIESTIVDLTEQEPVILRPGYITQAMLEEVTAGVKMDRGLLETAKDVRPKAPGMKYRHYAPKAELVLVQGELSNVPDVIKEQVRQLSMEGKKSGVICCEETRLRYADTDAEILSIGSRRDEATIAHNLYDVLRAFDEKEVDRIYSECFDTPMLGDAVMNRMRKAAGQKVLYVTDEKGVQKH
jgi:L-threonylcarbamoyladenylate synthase